MPYSSTLNHPLSEGLLLHAARAQWLYDNREGDLWRQAIDRYVSKFEEMEKMKLFPGAKLSALRDFEGYAKYWNLRPTTECLAIEHLVGPKILSPDAPAWAARTARYDSIERWRGKTWIGELKSTSSGAGRVHDLFVLNIQTLLCAALWGPEETSKFGELGGILLDPLIKGSGRTPGRGSTRIEIPISQLSHALTWFRRDFTTWVMQSKMIKWNDGVERKPMCMRPYGPCDYRELCLRGRAAATHYIFKDDGSSILSWKPSHQKEVPPWE